MHSHKAITFCLYTIIGLATFFTECSEKKHALEYILDDKNALNSFQTEAAGIPQSAFKKVKRDNEPSNSAVPISTTSLQQSTSTLVILNFRDIDTQEKYTTKLTEFGKTTIIRLECDGKNCKSYRNDKLPDAYSSMVNHRKNKHFICKCNKRHDDSQKALECKDCCRKYTKKASNYQNVESLNCGVLENKALIGASILIHPQLFVDFLDVSTLEKYRALENQFKNQKPSHIKITCNVCTHHTPQIPSEEFYRAYEEIIRHRLEKHYICKCNLGHISLKNAIDCHCKPLKNRSYIELNPNFKHFKKEN